ncbi:hypothetical protein GCM10018779_66820 [Streptomyces griseocarneus]|nr:hypothetical protein GCM10018779_66820 [Streptomyces griseocarneus]
MSAVGAGAGGGAGIRPLEEGDPECLGSYMLAGRLASGGMGRVFLARSLRDGGLAAVKTLLAEGEISATDRKRFAREVKVARRAEGVHTAMVLDADPDAPRPWMATEYIPAPSLTELVRRAGPLTGAAARWVTRGTLEALAELHRHGIVHRDVKPHNLLLPLGGPRLIDFGISHASDLTRTQLTLGTMAFTSPEQARGEPSTAASDVYSLGATLFHLAVGRAPYPPGIEMPLLLTYAAEANVDLAGLPDELVPVVRACLALAPDDRPRVTDLLDRFTFELAEMPTAPDASGWLPAPWARIIEEYAHQGRELAAGRVDEHTRILEERTKVLSAAGDSAAGAQVQSTPPTDMRHGRGGRIIVRSVRLIMASILLFLAGGLAYGYYRVQQAKEPDSADRAFAAVPSGTCVSTGFSTDGVWMAPTPETVNCASPEALWRVISTSKGRLAERCMGTDGAVRWTRQSPAGIISLCLERQFTQGECVVGDEPVSGITLRVVPLKGAYMFATNVSCSASAPQGYAVLRVAAYGPATDGCPAQSQVRYEFTERGRLLCLTSV